MTHPWVLVTGAAAGTGLTIARHFMQAGYGAFLTSRDGAAAEEAAASLRKDFDLPAIGVGLDPADGEKAVVDMFARLQQDQVRLEALVLNAANMGIGMDPLTVDGTEWAEVIRTNVVWNFLISRHAARMMKDNGGGSITFIGSNTCRRAISERSAYIASKGALAGMTKALAIDLAQYNIRVNCLMPGVIATTRWNARTPESQLDRTDRIPLGKVATFDDIAEAVLYMARAGQLTGSELVLDGGVDAKLWC